LIADFESRLATVLGARLPAPLTGHAHVAPGTGNESQVLVGVTRATRVMEDFGAHRSEHVPGADAGRRVLRLRCTVGLEVLPAANAGRAAQLELLESALYALDAADFRSGAALAGGAADPGFVIRTLDLVEAVTALHPDVDGVAPLGATLAADGLFWPIGVPGQAGVAVVEVRLRGAAVPLVSTPERPRLQAGGDPLELSLRIVPQGALRIREDGADAAPGGFGSLAVRLVAPDGGAGKGALDGGQAGDGPWRLLAVADGVASVRYQPPAEPAADALVVALDDGERRGNVELGRVPIEVVT
jgi:hypothetical protein